MAERHRLTNDDFTALRSLQKGPWTVDENIIWKHNRHWYEVRGDGCVRDANSYGLFRFLPLPGDDDLYDRAYAALRRLGSLGYVCRHKILCCPGEACHRNDKVVWKLTREGEEFLARLRTRLPEPVIDAPRPSTTVAPGILARIWSWACGHGALQSNDRSGRV